MAGKKRKTSFIRKLYEKLNPNAPAEPEDPGVELNDEELAELAALAAEEEAESEAAEAAPEGPEGSIATTQIPPPQQMPPKSNGNEIAQELRTAFELYSKGLDSIPCKEVGYILRTLGQNPTEDEIIALVCEAGCDWEGHFTCEDFLNLAYGSVQKQVNRLDDVRAAFKAFDHNGDGSISREELKDAMVRFGETFSPEECEEMFREADLNEDGKIDWEEFLQMMLPGHTHTNYREEDPTPADKASTRSRKSSTAQ